MRASQAKSYQLSTGLKVKLLSDPQLNHAAAVWLVPNGSHQEPERWPGLAHLTEHMLFAGGKTFPGAQRLMPWIQQHAGRINATTQQNFTAYYFEVVSERLDQGLARLYDMLNTPLFAQADIGRETQVIDEEFQLYCTSSSALVDTVLRSKITEPENFSRFYIGNRATFGQDKSALAEALTAFFKQSYSLERGELWIVSPFPVDQVASRVATLFNNTIVPVQVTGKATVNGIAASSAISFPSWRGELALENVNGLCITVAIPQGPVGMWPLFTQLLTDNAPGSFCQQLITTLGLAVTVRLERQYHDNQQCWFTLWIEDSEFSTEQGELCLILLKQWMSAVVELTPEQLEHYYRLAESEIAQQPLMERLRDIAIGAGVGELSELWSQWQYFRQALQHIPSYGMLYLRSNQEIASQDLLGLPCRFRRCEEETVSAISNRQFLFYPQPLISSATHEASGTLASIPLHFCVESRDSYSLLIRPAVGTAISDRVRQQLTRELAPVLSLARHYGGQALWQQLMGNDTLCFSFVQASDLERCVEALVTYWPDVLVSGEEGQYGHLPLRHFLGAVPSMLAESIVSCPWIASFAGPDATVGRQIAARLAQLPVDWRPATRDTFTLPATAYHWPSRQTEARLMAFVPYPVVTIGEISQFQQLASHYECAFYHQLREVQAVGYAVACRQRYYRERWGLQIILQSNQYSSAQLYRQVCDFFQRISLPDRELSSSRQAMEIEKSGLIEWDRHLASLSSVLTPAYEGISVTDDLSLVALHRRLFCAVAQKAGIWICCDSEKKS